MIDFDLNTHMLDLRPGLQKVADQKERHLQNHQNDRLREREKESEVGAAERGKKDERKET